MKLTARRDSGSSTLAWPSWVATSGAYRIRRQVAKGRYIVWSGVMGWALGVS